MALVENVDVLIVGSGPAGTSAALHLVQADPNWAQRIIVIDKAVHPREKLCGGGITHMGQNVLADLGLTIEVPKFPVREAKITFQDLAYSIVGNPVFILVQRDEFDHWLVKKAEERGVDIRQGQALTDIQVRDDYVEVTTALTRIRASAVIAADGSRSIVRTKLKWDDDSRVARLLEILTPEDRKQAAFQDNVAVIDFSRISDGLQGYYWDFPSLVKGKPTMNRGLFDSRIHPKRPKANLKSNLEDALADRQRDLADYQLKGHPIRWFDKNGRYSVPRVLLAWDSAGADPFVGEGISFALSYGQVAADAIVDAFSRNDFAFSDYRQRILEHKVLKQLPTRVLLARLAYRIKSPRIFRLGWRAAQYLIRYSSWSDPDYDPVKKPIQGYDVREGFEPLITP